MRGAPEYADVLARTGFRVLSFAGNHTMDYGWQAVQETMHRLAAVGVLTVGAGVDLAAARKPVVVEVRGLSIAVLSYCSVNVGVPLYAAEDRPGVAYADPEWIKEDVIKARRDSDIVIVCLHWGDEFVGFPRPEQREMAREILEAGAHLVLGHHPHVLQGIERIGKGVAAYSLGNFVFSDEDWRGTDRKGHSFVWPFRLSSDCRQSAIFRATVSREQVADAKIDPAYLGPDLKVIPGGRGRELVARRSRPLALNALYPAYWACRFFIARFAAQYWQNYRHRDPANIRPRHVKSLLKTLRHEFQHFRGVKE
jgi:hypothetical protein